MKPLQRAAIIAVGSELKFMLQGANECVRKVYPDLDAAELAKY